MGQQSEESLGTSDSVETSAIRLHVRQAGPDDGPPVVLLHGFPEFWYGWHRQIEPLAAAGYRVVVPDQRGYNRSDKPTGVAAYHVDRLASDVVGLLDALGHERATVVGHDWGAMVGWWLATEHPERLDGLCAMNVPHPGAFGDVLLRSPRQLLASTYALFFQLPWLPETALRARNWDVLSRALTDESRPGTFSEADLRRYRHAWGREGALTGMLNWYRAAGRFPTMFSRRDRVRVPTLVLWGAQDRALQRELAPESVALCDDGRLEWFEDATHWLHHEEPEAITDQLLGFCESPTNE